MQGSAHCCLQEIRPRSTILGAQAPILGPQEAQATIMHSPGQVEVGRVLDSEASTVARHPKLCRSTPAPGRGHLGQCRLGDCSSYC